MQTATVSEILPVEIEGVGVIDFKLRSIIIIFIISLFGGLLPTKVTTSRRLLSIGNALSGGVFLSAGVLHMLMEGVEGFADLGIEADVALVLFIAGILLPFFFENVLMADGQNHHDVFVNYEEGMSRSLGVYLIMIMLSVHSLVEGFALGVQEEIDDANTILLAIISHKFFAAFALGVSLVKKSEQLSMMRIIQLICIFSITTPVGIGAGMSVTAALDGRIESILSESLKVFAAGTFVYVALVEVILEEFGHSHGSHNSHDDEESHGHHHEEEEKGKKDKYLKFLAIIVGVAIQVFLGRYFSHAHEH